VSEGDPKGGGNGGALSPAQHDQAGQQALQQLVSQQRPARMVGLLTMRAMRPHEMERLVGVCLQAMREEDQGAALTLLPLGDPAPAELARQRTWRLTMAVSAEAPPHDCLVQLFAADDPQSSHHALLEHLASRDADLGEQARQAARGAQTYLTLTSGRLDDQQRIHPFQNIVSLFSSALGAAIIDPAAAIVTGDPGEWAEAMEMSLHLEKEMFAVNRPKA
jgi:hypothetical protein